MAIALDGSTPAYSATVGGTNLGASVTSGPTTKVSASFSPPAGSLVVVSVIASYKSAASYAVTGLTLADSLSNAYTAAVSQTPNSVTATGWGSIVFYPRYYAAAPGSVTVTATLAAAEVLAAGTALDVVPYVLSGAASSQAGAATATGGSVSGTAETVSVTTTTVGSWVMLAGINGTGVATSAAANTTATQLGTGDGGGNSAAWGRQTAATVTPGAITLGFTCGSSSGSALQCVALEILPAAAPAVTGGESRLVTQAVKRAAYW